jgi:hypothetical protein
MTPALEYLGLAAGLFSAVQVGLIIVTMGQSRRYRRMAKFERIRTRFAAARGRLVLIAAERELSPNSITFRQLYAIQTTMMRRFDSYPRMSRIFWTHLFDGKLTPAKLHTEAQQWNEATKSVVVDTADALRHVWIGCMPFGTSVTVGRRLAAFAGVSLVKLLAQQLSRLAPPAMREIREAEELLRRQVA